jgi:hypothetical protein
MVRFPLMLSALLTSATIPVNGGEPLRISVSPLQSFAPSTVNIRARVVPSDENRALQVVAESSNFYRSSQMTLEGAQAPAMIAFEFRGLPSGDYDISAILTDSSGHQRAIAEQRARVVSSGGQ